MLNLKEGERGGKGGRRVEIMKNPAIMGSRPAVPVVTSTVKESDIPVKKGRLSDGIKNLVMLLTRGTTKI